MQKAPLSMRKINVLSLAKPVAEYTILTHLAQGGRRYVCEREHHALSTGQPVSCYKKVAVIGIFHHKINSRQKEHNYTRL